MLITEFSYREIDCSACGKKPYSLLSPGGFMAGPRALRPERLEWLRTPAVNRQVFRPWRFCLRKTLGSMWRAEVAPRACPQKHAGSGHRAIWGSRRSVIWPYIAAFPACSASAASGCGFQQAFPGREALASRRFFPKILKWRRAGGGNIPSIFLFSVVMR